MSGIVRRKSMARRMSTRTSSSLNKVDTGVQRTKNEEKMNMNAIIIKNLGYTNPQIGKQEYIIITQIHHIKILIMKKLI